VFRDSLLTLLVVVVVAVVEVQVITEAGRVAVGALTLKCR
jgi:hypothetical protein